MLRVRPNQPAVRKQQELHEFEQVRRRNKNCLMFLYENHSALFYINVNSLTYFFFRILSIYCIRSLFLLSKVFSIFIHIFMSGEGWSGVGFSKNIRNFTGMAHVISFFFEIEAFCGDFTALG